MVIFAVASETFRVVRFGDGADSSSEVMRGIYGTEGQTPLDRSSHKRREPLILLVYKKLE